MTMSSGEVDVDNNTKLLIPKGDEGSAPTDAGALFFDEGGNVLRIGDGSGTVTQIYKRQS